jgi:peroxiredoxin
MLKCNYSYPFRVLLLILFTTLLSLPVIAGNDVTGYSIKVKITNCTDTLLYLNHYSGEDIINDDTAFQNKEGYFIFSGKNNLEEGLYFISSNSKKRFFDFFVAENQNIRFEYDGSGLMKNMKTSDSIENLPYFRLLAALQANLNVKNKTPNDSISYLLDHTDLMVPFIKQIIDKPKDKMVLSEKYINACISPSAYQKFYYKLKSRGKELTLETYLDHFFDNFDFSDFRLANTPVFTQRIDEFVDTISALPVASKKQEIDRLIGLSSVNKKTQEYVAWYLISHFKTYYFLPDNDALYVHVVKDYLANDKIAWYYPVVKDRELSQVIKFESLLNGKTAPDIEMPDTSGLFHNLYTVKAQYTLLLFWASTCSHCRDEMPAVLKLYKDFRTSYDLEIFAVSTDTSAIRWKSYVKRHQLPWINVFGRKGRQSYFHLYNIQSTPTLFLLDDKKTILAKYLTLEKIAEIIKEREKAKKEK